MIREKSIQHYIENALVPSLHLGCGPYQLTGWLNTDYSPTSPDIIFLDATHVFPFDDNTFNFVYSEHMIEHLSLEGGINLIKESFRVLKPNGRIRLTTPNLNFLFELYANSEISKKYIKFASDEFIKSGYYSEAMVINNFMRAWGHQFIYDERTLTRILESNGFRNVESFQIGVSNFTNLSKLEKPERLPESFLQLESMTLEAVKF